MTIWHFKGVRLSQICTNARYRYFPDHVTDGSVSGVFEVDTETWTFEILLAAEAEANGLVSTDEHCVRALIHKLKAVVGELPDEVFFTA